MTVGIDAVLQEVNGLYDIQIDAVQIPRIFFAMDNDSSNWVAKTQTDFADESVIVAPNSTGSLRLVKNATSSSVTATKTMPVTDITGMFFSCWVYFDTALHALFTSIDFRFRDTDNDSAVFNFDDSLFLQAETWYKVSVSIDSDTPDVEVGTPDFTIMDDIVVQCWFSGSGTEKFYFDSVQLAPYVGDGEAFTGSGDIVSSDFFDTAILVSLFAEKRANESEVLEPLLRRGWIGNEVTPGFEIGSKIWLYEQSRLTNSVLNSITNAAKQALQWLVDDGFAVSIDDVEAIVTKTGINLTVTIRRPNSKVEKRHYTLWDNSALS